ncbi:flagellar hook protein FlgE [Janthinobacterium fluminis]|uniref:Flagellar hook protein FlgE n=1 Tax=Janthinobacterium fluminis TaxID=2987524 RepID=A0ABT5JUR1_9BURK|nr:flagellar hook-basal body complex protein [Janthinobacterium fluminis]MDC8756481.1 flagellar hook-basal body complex protein [Janthinobacterium fluminis]
MSFDIALSGIQAINNQLNTVSNNIANAGTYGFKSSRANFSSMYAGAQATGVEVGSVTQNIGRNGGVLNTGRTLDASINGRGFFVSRDSQNTQLFSRVGIFKANSTGFLEDSAGNKVQGYGVKPGSSVLGALGDIQVPTGQIPAVASTKMGYVANMSLEWTVPALPFNQTDLTTYNMSKLSVIYDSLGGKHNITQYFTKTAPNTIKVNYSIDNGPATATSNLTFNASGALTSPPVVGVVVPTTNGSISGATVNINYTGTTQFAGEATTSADSPDGYASGSFTGVQLDENGSVVAAYTNGQKQTIAVLALASFPDEGALTPVNDTSWVATATAGTPLFDRPGTGMAGKLSVATLEQSNVDITSELVGLMTSQRNYQANSKVISTESAMMQSLMQAL